MACDSYHRYKDDVAMLASIGAKVYHFSLSWPRIIPLGGRNDPANADGLQYYLDLIDELKANDIEPMVTLYHWDLPEELDKRSTISHLPSCCDIDVLTDMVAF